MDFVKAMRKVIQNEMQVSEACGATKECREATHLGPWSPEARRLFKEEL